MDRLLDFLDCLLSPPQRVWNIKPGSALRFALAHFVPTPLGAYKTILEARNWVLATADYLKSESDKWRRVFATLKMVWVLLASPYRGARAVGLNPQAAIGASAIFFGGGTAIVADQVLEGRSFQRGDSGVYTAPLDVPTEWSEANNTLDVQLGSTEIGTIVIENVTVGTAYTGSALPTGETNAILIGGLPETTTPAFTETFLEVGYLTIEKWACDDLNLTNIEAYQLNIKYNASDGQSISPVAGTPRNRGIGGGNRADSMTTSGGLYDQIKVQAATSGVNGKVDVLTLSNINSSGGPCVLDRIKAGTIDVILNEIGGDADFSTKEFTIATTVVYKNILNVDNVEVSGL